MKPQTQTQKDADRHRHTHSFTHHTDSHHNRRKTATGQIELAQIGKSASFSTDVTVFALFVPGDMCVVLSSPPSRGLRCHLPPRPFFLGGNGLWPPASFGVAFFLSLLWVVVPVSPRGVGTKSQNVGKPQRTYNMMTTCSRKSWRRDDAKPEYRQSECAMPRRKGAEDDGKQKTWERGTHDKETRKGSELQPNQHNR